MDNNRFALFLQEAGVRYFQQSAIQFLVSEEKLFRFQLHKAASAKPRFSTQHILAFYLQFFPRDAWFSIKRSQKFLKDGNIPLNFEVIEWMLSFGFAEAAVLLQEMCYRAVFDIYYRKQLKGIDTVEEMFSKLCLSPSHLRKLHIEWQKLKKFCEKEAKEKYTEAEARVVKLAVYSPRALGINNIEIKQVEDSYRKLLVSKDPKDIETLTKSGFGSDLLVDVYKEYSTFITEGNHDGITNLLNNKPKSFPKTHQSIVSLDKFQKQFAQLSNNLFNGMDWSNLVAAGGSVLGSLSANFASYAKSDIDLFVYGLNPEEATKKVKSTIEFLAKKLPYKGGVLISAHSVTLLGVEGQRSIQFILRSYRSIAEVLIGFDIDCCSFGYDGKTVWAIPRSRRAVNQQRNIVDLSRRSYTYEARLLKYAERGYCIGVPGLQLKYVDPSRLGTRTSGLASLIRRERGFYRRVSIPLSQQIYFPKRFDNPYSKRPPNLNNNSKDTSNSNSNSNANSNENSTTTISEKKTETLEFIQGDYDWTLPGYITESYLELIFRNNKTSFTMFDGTTVYLCQPKDLHKYSFTWITENPGKQMFTGSFHPLEDSLWEAREQWDKRIPASYRFVHLTVSDSLSKRKALRELNKVPIATQVLVRLTGIPPEIVPLILKRLSQRDVGILSLVCKVEGTKTQKIPYPTLEDITIPPISPTPEYELFEQALNDVISKEEISAQEKEVVNLYFKNLFSNVLPALVNLERRVSIDDRIQNFLTSYVFNTSYDYYYGSRWGGTNWSNSFVNAIKSIYGRITQMKASSNIYEAILLFRQSPYVPILKKVEGSTPEPIFITNTYPCERDSEPLLKEIIKNLLRQFLPAIKELSKSKVITEEDVWDAVNVAKIWQVNTFPFVNSAQGIRVASIDQARFDELFTEANETKHEWSNQVKDVIKRIVETWIDELIITSFVVTEGNHRSVVSSKDIQVVLVCREQLDLFTPTIDVTKTCTFPMCVDGWKTPSINEDRYYRDARKIINRPIDYLIYDEDELRKSTFRLQKFLAEAHIAQLASAGYFVCKHFGEHILTAEHLKLAKIIIFGIQEEKANSKMQPEKEDDESSPEISDESDEFYDDYPHDIDEVDEENDDADLDDEDGDEKDDTF